MVVHGRVLGAMLATVLVADVRGADGTYAFQLTPKEMDIGDRRRPNLASLISGLFYVHNHMLCCISSMHAAHNGVTLNSSVAIASLEMVLCRGWKCHSRPAVLRRILEPMSISYGYVLLQSRCCVSNVVLVVEPRTGFRL